MDSFKKNPIIEFLDSTLRAYPDSGLRDIYKILYQAFHGAEHYASSSDEARMWLDREWEALIIPEVRSSPELLEPVFIGTITPELYRLNLAPAKRLEIDKEKILDEFVRTASEFPKNYPTDDENLHEGFKKVWDDIGEAVTSGILEFDSEEYRELTHIIEQNEWPALQHSEKYRLIYKPHYRLVMNPKFTGQV
ncbi:MAG: hypothetical protein NTY09_07080 [bacterium]|nr:hypothetical protein [bacterium]